MGNIDDATLSDAQIIEQLPSRPPVSVTVIRPSRGWVADQLRGSCGRYRELLYFLTWRDIKVRYKQTALGALWAVIQPVLTMAVFSVFFGRLAKCRRTGSLTRSSRLAAFAVAALRVRAHAIEQQRRREQEPRVARSISRG